MIRGNKGGKGGGGHKYHEDPNNLKSVSTAKVLDLISEGEIVGLVNGHRCFRRQAGVQQLKNMRSFAGRIRPAVFFQLFGTRFKFRELRALVSIRKQIYISIAPLKSDTNAQLTG